MSAAVQKLDASKHGKKSMLHPAHSGAIRLQLIPPMWCRGSMLSPESAELRPSELAMPMPASCSRRSEKPTERGSPVLPDVRSNKT